MSKDKNAKGARAGFSARVNHTIEMVRVHTQQLSGHTLALNDLNAANLAMLETLIAAGVTTEEDFQRLKAKYGAKLEQASAARRDAAIAELRAEEEEEKGDDLNWKHAAEHLQDTFDNYVSIGLSGQPALHAVILPLKQRYDSGERSQDLYDAILALE